MKPSAGLSLWLEQKIRNNGVRMSCFGPQRVYFELKLLSLCRH